MELLVADEVAWEERWCPFRFTPKPVDFDIFGQRCRAQPACVAYYAETLGTLPPISTGYRREINPDVLGLNEFEAPAEQVRASHAFPSNHCVCIRVQCTDPRSRGHRSELIAGATAAPP